MELAQSSTLQTHSEGDTARLTPALKSSPLLLSTLWILLNREECVGSSAVQVRPKFGWQWYFWRSGSGPGGGGRRQGMAVYSPVGPFLNSVAQTQMLSTVWIWAPNWSGGHRGPVDATPASPESQGGEGSTGWWGLQSEDRPSLPWSSSVNRR